MLCCQAAEVAVDHWGSVGLWTRRCAGGQTGTTLSTALQRTLTATRPQLDCDWLWIQSYLFYKALWTSAVVTVWFIVSRPEPPQRNQCRTRITVARNISLERRTQGSKMERNPAPTMTHPFLAVPGRG
jgi:hypothetical protein